MTYLEKIQNHVPPCTAYHPLMTAPCPLCGTVPEQTPSDRVWAKRWKTKQEGLV